MLGYFSLSPMSVLQSRSLWVGRGTGGCSRPLMLPPFLCRLGSLLLPCHLLLSEFQLPQTDMQIQVSNKHVLMDIPPSAHDISCPQRPEATAPTNSEVSRLILEGRDGAWRPCLITPGLPRAKLQEDALVGKLFHDLSQYNLYVTCPF